MKILITGASGYIGNNLAHKLAAAGNEVHALVRSDSVKRFLQHPTITIFKGDILDRKSLSMAMKECQRVFHVAGKVGAWAKDPSVYYSVNVEGTKNVLDIGLQTGIEKIVFTSSCGVIGPSNKDPLNEKHIRTAEFGMDYDRSKKMGEDVVLQYAKDGMNAVVVNPPKIYGPGTISHSLTANALIDKFLRKKIASVPAPGTYRVCFAFIDDIVNGHILAMEKGKAGERYIIGGINISYHDFFDRIRTLSSCRGKIISVPRSIINIWGHLQMLNYKFTGHYPAFSVKSTGYIFKNYVFSSEKAIRELGYSITPLDEALLKTIHFLNGH